MAEKSPGGEGQTPFKCQLCDVSKIEVNCLNCDLFLCNSCSTKIHSKSKKLQDHKIVNLERIGTEEVADIHREVDLENIECANHQGQKCVCYCKDCDKSICLSCLTSSHYNHKQCELKSFYEENFTFIKKQREEINKDITFFKDEEERLKDLLTENQKKHCDLSEAISNQEQKGIQLLKSYAESLCKQINDVYNPTVVNIQNALEKVTKEKERLFHRKESIDHILLSHKAIEIIDARSSINPELPEKVTKEIKGSNLKLFSALLNNVELDKIFGKIQKIPKLELMSTYETNLVNVLCLTHNYKETSEIVIGSLASQKLQFVKIENVKMKKIKEETIQVYDIAVKNTGDILISTGENDLKIYTLKNSFETFKTFPNQFTVGINVNQQNQIVVGLSEAQSIKNIKEQTNIQIVIMSESGDLKHIFDFDKNNKRLFCWPRRIITCGDNICVADLQNSSYEGRVVMIDHASNIKWTYMGTEGDGTIEKFYPVDLTATSTDMILICDVNNSYLHILNQCGEVIAYHNCKNIGIELPCSITIDTKSFVWVGCNTQRNEKQSDHQLNCISYN